MTDAGENLRDQYIRRGAEGTLHCNFNFGGDGRVAVIAPVRWTIYGVNLEKEKDITCNHEYAVTFSNQFRVFDAVEDPIEL